MPYAKAFAAGFISTLIFHQGLLGLLFLAGAAPRAPFNLAPAGPLGVPSVISLAFWGGVWGILFVLIERWLARFPGGYWVGATVFGAIVATLVLMFIVFPLRGQPVGAGFASNLIITFLIVHGLWGLGTGVFLGVLTGWRNRPG